MNRVRLIVLTAILLSAVGHAQAIEAGRSSWFEALLQWAPIIFLIGLWIFIIRKASPQAKTQKAYLDRGMAHMDAVEARLTEVATHLHRLVELAEKSESSSKPAS